LIVRDASLSYVLSLLAERRGLNIVASNDIDVVVSLSLYNKTVEEALTAILSVANYTWTKHEGIIYVTSISQANALPARLQDRRIQVFPLDYASGQALMEAVQGFLSPVGQVFVNTADPQNNRLTQETLVVEDLPYALARIAVFVEQMDQPPRQVLIEAHVLQVELQDDREHGVNFEYLFNTIGTEVSTLGTFGLAPTTPSPAFFAAVTEGHLKTFVQLLKTTTDAKTLASPRLLVLNEQTARMHVGEQIGYRQTTTTETSANEGAAFVEVGVILEITPRITRDNQIVLHVRPEVSDGQINPDTQVPDTQKTELETNVLLRNGYGVVIGGLIKETDSVIQRKVPYLGDVYLVGKLFQHQTVTKERNEIIVVLIPRIYPYAYDYAAYEDGNIVRTETELFEGPLMRKDRPWAPKLPDAVVNPRIARVPPVGKTFPYPARLVEMAATPQPQGEYPVAPRPGPAVNFAPGQGPLPSQFGPADFVPLRDGVVISDAPIVFGAGVPPAQVQQAPNPLADPPPRAPAVPGAR
jgi:type II secretory pathway component GspD/PulD (secretin)